MESETAKAASAFPLDRRVTRSNEVVDREVDGETMLLSMATAKYYSLDTVGTRIWQLLAEPATVTELCQTLRKEYEVTDEECRRDVVEFMERLAKDGIVSVAAPEK